MNETRSKSFYILAAFFGLLSGKLQVAINAAEDKQKINRGMR